MSTSVAEISVHEPLFTVFPLSTMLMDAEDQGTPRSVLNTTMEHDKPKILSDDEKDEILIKNFMYSLRAPRGTEACMVCKVGGQLLVCRFRSCRRVVHERCIGVAATRSSYCPFCQAISEYSECKKKYCLARKALVALIDQDEYRVRNSSNISRKSDEDTSKESETSSNCIEQNRLESVQNGEAESSRQGGSEQPAIAKLKEVSPQPYPLPLRLRKKRQPWSKDEEEALMVTLYSLIVP